MKKLVILLLCAFGAVSLNAQSYTFRKSFHNFSFVSQKFTLDGVKNADMGFEKGIGAAYTTGRTFVLHPGAIGGMFRFGIDAVWADVNFSSYKSRAGFNKTKINQYEVGVGVGPGIHVNPVSDLGIHAYFRYMPTASGMHQRFNFIDNDPEHRGYIGFASFFTAGGALSWKFISLGAEARWGNSKYNTKKDDKGDGDQNALNDPKMKTSGLRAYLSIRF